MLQQYYTIVLGILEQNIALYTIFHAKQVNRLCRGRLILFQYKSTVLGIKEFNLKKKYTKASKILKILEEEIIEKSQNQVPHTSKT